MMRIVVQTLVDALLIFAVIALLPFAWIMRDGMGPDAVASFGTQALARCFMTFYSGPILIGLTALAIACHRIGNKKQAKSVGQ